MGFAKSTWRCAWTDRSVNRLTHHRAGVEHNSNDLGPSQPRLNRHVRLHQLGNWNESPVVRRGLRRCSFREIVKNSETPLVKRAGPDLVIVGSVIFMTTLAGAVLNLHGLLKVKVRPASFGQ
jgi:hypothetical protein